MADETTPIAVQPPVTTTTPPPADEGFLHSLATSLGLDPEAVKAAGKSLWAHPIQTAEAVGSEAVTEAADAVKNAKQTITDTAKGVGAGLGVDPTAQATAATRFKSPGILNKVAGATEYLTSGVPLVGSNLVKAEEQGARGNAPGAMGTTLGTIAPMLIGTEGAEDIKAHLADTARTAVEGAKEEVTNAVNAKAPAGSTEAGAVKIKAAPEKKFPVPEENQGTEKQVLKKGGWLLPDGQNYVHVDDQETHGESAKKMGFTGPTSGSYQGYPITPVTTKLGARVDALNKGAVRATVDRVGTTTLEVFGITDASKSRLGDALAVAPTNKPVFLAYSGGGDATFQNTHPPKEFNNPAEAMDWLDRQTPQSTPAITFEQLGGKEVLSAEDRGDLLTQERQSQLKEPYKVKIANTMTGDRRVEPIDAFSSKDAIRTAQKKFPDANEYTIQEFGERTPSNQYSVPTGKILSMPGGDTPQRTYVSTIRHELGHALIGQNDGLALKGMLRHTHIDSPGTMRAGILWDGRSILQNGRVAPEKVPGVMRSLMGGIAADEAFNDVPRAANHNFDIRAYGGDANKAYLMLKAAGYDHDTAMDMLHTAVDQGKEYLNRPEVSGIIKENEAVREPGLSRQYHYSSERLQNMHQEVQRRINAAGTEKPDNGTVGAENSGKRPENVASGEGETAPASGQGVQKNLFTPEIKNEQDEEPGPVSQKLLNQFGTTTNPHKAGFILPDGQMVVRPSGVEHDSMLKAVHPDQMSARGYTGPLRTNFINDENAIRTRFTHAYAPGQSELTFSVPKNGVTEEQAAQIRASVGKLREVGGGRLVLEKADPASSPTIKEMARVSDVEPMLRELGVHPDQAELLTAETKQPKIVPNPALQASAQKYAKAQGMDEINHTPVQQDPARAAEIAKIYDEAQHDPNNPRVKAAYDALKSETLAQFNHLRGDLGLKFEPQVEDPYASAGEMMNDIKKNNTLKVFTGGSDLPKDHPLAEVEPKTGETYNTIFRWVHDAMGHAAGGNDFSENGERSATEAHAQMYSDTARPAMRAETEGQTSWFFHNPDIEAGRTIPGQFAEQKATVLPDTSADWHKTAGDMAAKESAGGINPRTGKTDSKGIGIEVAPEFRQQLDHVPTAADFKAFYDQHKEIFDQYPELRVGWDNKSKVGSGYEINMGAVGKDAVRVAKKLDQRAAWDIAKGEEIPTGGSELRTEFPNYSIEERLKDLRGENQSDVPGFEHLSKDVHDHLEPDERDYLKDNKTLQRNVMTQYHRIQPSVPETTNAMQAGAALGGWWKRYIDVFHGLVGEDAEPVLYHGSTTKGIKNLELRPGANSTVFGNDPVQRAGIFLTPDKNFASSFAGRNGEVTTHAVNFKNTADFTDNTTISTGERGYVTAYSRLIDELVGEGINRRWLEGPKKTWELFDGDDGQQLVAALKERGYDSAKIEEDDDSGKPTVSYIAFSPNQLKPTAEQVANTIGPSHAEVLKQWHAAVSGNKSVQDANNLAWHSYADWLDAGKPTDRKSIDDIVRKNGAQPAGSGKKGNGSISDTLDRRGKVVSKGLDTNKLYLLVNSPEMRGEKPFSGDVFRDDAKNPLMGPTEGARKIPSMGATVAGKGNLNRLVIDAHIRDFYGQGAAGPASQYIADSVHLRQAAEALGLKGGEGQEQLWGTVLGLKTLLKEGLTPEEAGGKLNADVINRIGKDYAEVIQNDPEITAPGGVLDRLKEQPGVGRGSAGVGEANRQAPSTSASEGVSTSSQAATDQTQLAKTAERIRGQISESKIKKTGAVPAGKSKTSALDLIKMLGNLKKPAK